MVDPAPQLTGAVVTDAHGEKIGTVTDVVYDDRTMQPCWAVVTYGLFKQHHRILPVDEVYRSANGHVVAALDKSTVRHAPGVGAREPVTPDIERQARDYYQRVA